MIAVRIGPDWRLVVVGSPSYLAGRSLPDNLRLTTYGGLYAWEFENAGQTLNVRVDGQLVFNSTLPILQASLAGHGLAYVPEDMALPYIAQGKLVRVLDEWCPPFPGYHLYYPSRRQASPAFAAVVDALRYRG